MLQTFVVVIYGPDLSYGREAVGAFQSRPEAEQRAADFPGRDVRILSHSEWVYRPNLRDLVSASKRTSLADIERLARRGRLRLAPRQDGLELYWNDSCVGRWPVGRRGSAPDGRVMPHDLWEWVFCCVLVPLPQPIFGYVRTARDGAHEHLFTVARSPLT